MTSIHDAGPKMTEYITVATRHSAMVVVGRLFDLSIDPLPINRR